VQKPLDGLVVRIVGIGHKLGIVAEWISSKMGSGVTFVLQWVVVNEEF